MTHPPPQPMGDDPISVCDMRGFDEACLRETMLALGLLPGDHRIAERIRAEFVVDWEEDLADTVLTALGGLPGIALPARQPMAVIRQGWIERLRRFGERFDTPHYFAERLQWAAACAHAGIPLAFLHLQLQVTQSILVERLLARYEHDPADLSALLPCLLKLTALELHLTIAGYRSQQIEDLQQSLKELQEKAASLYQKATTDQLTGVINFSSLVDTLDRQVAKAAQTGKPLCVIMADLDFFKRVNDVYGHLVGDIVLTHTAQRIKSAVRDSDLVGRFGGEEFTVILANADLELAGIIAERIRQEIAATPFHARGHVIEVTISLGVAMLEPGETPEALLERADAAMYEAKRAGRNRVAAAGDLPRAAGPAA